MSRAGETSPLGLPPGLLLGAGADSAYRVCTPRLRPGDLVLFHTDGLVERRVPAEALLEQVTATLSAFTAAPGEQTLGRLRELLHHPNPDDDTCTLAVRVLP
ncbi:SpoIIE family protein phosphatase [Micromonospora parastrephiae]|uniref:SpoIIE family protein phosphatase n=1 Tax=Micromonospora parastrephiae TaxID=2806101 RepID=UPI002816470C|nr:SpoIIE family protein phosphatase [Micromonospora parastrephiae]